MRCDINKAEQSNKLADQLSGQSASVTFTPESRDSLRVQYEAAIEQGIDPFLFNGTEYVVSYTKYLLEYLDMVLGETS